MAKESSGMIEIPVVVAGNWEAILYLQVDELSRMAVGYKVVNTTPNPVAVIIESEASPETRFTTRTTFPTGTAVGNIPGARRWNIDDETTSIYFSLTSKFATSSRI